MSPCSLALTTLSLAGTFGKTGEKGPTMEVKLPVQLWSKISRGPGEESNHFVTGSLQYVGEGEKDVVECSDPSLSPLVSITLHATPRCFCMLPRPSCACACGMPCMGADAERAAYPSKDDPDGWACPAIHHSAIRNPQGVVWCCWLLGAGKGRQGCNGAVRRWSMEGRMAASGAAETSGEGLRQVRLVDVDKMIIWRTWLGGRTLGEMGRKKRKRDGTS